MAHFALPTVAVRPFQPSGVESSDAPSIEELRTEKTRQIISDGTITVISGEVRNEYLFGAMWRMAVHGTSTFALVLAAGLLCLATLPLLLGYRPVLVTSGSMEPSIRTADVVITSATDGEGLSTGTVINFDSGESSLLHRIVEATDDGYRTKGDANTSEDSTIVTPDVVNGIGTVVVPFVGYPSLWLDNGQWLPLLVFMAACIAAMYFARSRWLEMDIKW